MTAYDYAMVQDPAPMCEHWIQNQCLLSGGQVDCFDKYDALVQRATFIRGVGHLIEVKTARGKERYAFDRVYSTNVKLKNKRRRERFTKAKELDGQRLLSFF